MVLQVTELALEEIGVAEAWRAATARVRDRMDLNILEIGSLRG